MLVNSLPLKQFLYSIVMTSSKSKRIAKNTLMLYIRMLFSMVVSLYTSRIILATLGETDFGIYNVVGGIVVMLGFLNSSLSGASSRYITYELAGNNLQRIRHVFSVIMEIHICLAFVILLLGETVGIWFLEYKLNIPPERMEAARWVFQFSLINTILGILSVPYNSMIVANEKMNVYAYISILDVVLKLVVVYVLTVFSWDKLILYGLLVLGVQVLTMSVYYFYSKRNFEGARFHIAWDKALFKEIFIFAGWTLNGNLAVVGYTQGLNVLLNMFYGPLVNAARGVAVQVQNVVLNFCSNFQMALNPQLTKSYAERDFSYMHRLLIVSSKFSFFLLLFLALPIILEADVILEVWLKEVPEYTVIFLRLILITSMFSALANPVIISVHATGKLRRFQLVEGTMLLLIVPIAYFILKFFDVHPATVFVVHLIIELCTQCARVRIVLPMINMNVRDYILLAVYPIIRVVLSSVILPIVAYCLLPHNTVVSFFVVCVISCISVLGCVFYLGCSLEERLFVREKLTVFFRSLKR